MITTVTLNPCNDRTVEIERFEIGKSSVILEEHFNYSGKGFNVSASLALWGEKTIATGLLFNKNGKKVQDYLLSLGCDVDCIWADGAVRTNTKIFDRSKKTITEFNQSGVPCDEKMFEQVLEKIKNLAKSASCIVLSGSLAPQMPLDTYARIIKLCKPYCKILLDAEGEKLLLGLSQSPNIIKPNLFELETAIGKKLASQSEILEAAKEIISKGVETILLSMGADGAMLINENEYYFSPAVENLIVRSTVGAGDSMAAAYLFALSNGYAQKDAFRYAVAGGSAACENSGTKMVEKHQLEAMLERVVII